MTSNDPSPYQGPQEQPGQYPYGGQQYDPYSGQPYPYPSAQPQQFGGAYPPPMPPAQYGYGYGPGYGQGYGYGPGYPPPQGESPRGQAIGALVTNIAATLLCCLPLGIAGIVVSAMAMSRADDQPDSARRLVKWGWWLGGVSIGLGLVVIVAYVVLIVTNPEFLE